MTGWHHLINPRKTVSRRLVFNGSTYPSSKKSDPRMSSTEPSPLVVNTAQSGEYRAELDGLRALAVTLVILNHSGVAFSGGFVGVDIFFVLSGYLMTGIICRGMLSGQFSFRQFFLRRIRRILPAKLVVTAFSLLVGWFLLLPSEYQDAGGLAFTETFLSSNVFLWRTTDYFGNAAERQPLLHYWSLATEEQFYLIFPVALLLLLKVGRKHLPYVIAILTTASLILSQALVLNKPWAAYYLLPSRAWELFLGSLVWWVSKRPPKCTRILQTAELVGTALLLVSASVIDKTTPFPGLAAFPVCVATALIIWSNSFDQMLLGKLLASRPLVYVGKLSYSLYLWHWPLLVFTRLFVFDEATAVLADSCFWVFTIVLSVSCHHLVERPARFQWLIHRQRRFVAANVALTLLLAGFASAIYLTKGLPNRFDPATLMIASDLLPPTAQGGNNIPLADVIDGKLARHGCENQCEGRILLWGDSHALALLPVLEEISQDRNLRLFRATYSRSAPVISMHYDDELYSLNELTPKYNAAVQDFVRTRQISCAVICCVWDFYAKPNRDRFRSEMRQGISDLISNGATVILVRDVARQNVNPGPALLAHQLLGRSPHTIGRQKKSHQDEVWKTESILVEIAEEFPEVVVLDPAESLCGNADIWPVSHQSRLVYRDRDHLSSYGSLLLKPHFSKSFDLLISKKLPDRTSSDRQGRTP